MVPKMLVDIRYAHKRTDIGEHFTHEIFKSIVIYIFTTGGKRASD